MNTQTPHPHKDLYINHKLTSEEGRYPLTLLDRYHLIGCYWQTSIFGLIANLFVPLIAAAGKLRAEGHSEITDLSVHSWSIDREVCWYIARHLGAGVSLEGLSVGEGTIPGRGWVRHHAKRVKFPKRRLEFR